MAVNESRSLAVSSGAHLEPEPLTKGQRLAATAVGATLTSAGMVSVFLGENQAGSAVALLAGAVFLLVAVSGMPILGARLKDFELHLASRWRQTAADVATRLPSGDGRRLLQVINSVDPGAYDATPLLALIDRLFFEARVKDAVVTALYEGERVESHPDADIGESLIDWVSRQGDVQITIFAAFAPTESGDISEPFVDQFLQRLPRSGCDALIMITCGRAEGDLARLVSRVRQEAGVPVAIEDWGPGGNSRSIRPQIDRLLADVNAARATSSDRASSPPREDRLPRPK